MVYMMNSVRRAGSRLLAMLLSLSLALMPVTASLAQVNDNAEDTEAPVLIHRQLEEGIAGELQTFLARVSDDFAVGEVTLYYRQSAGGEFESLSMRPLIDSIGEYMIAVETEIDAYRGLQYYIEATDMAGNTTNRGFAYAPIVLTLAAPAVTTAEVEPGPQSDGFSVSPMTILLGVGALLALGALAGGSGSEPSGTETPGTMTPDTVTLTVISDPPSAE